MNKKRRKYKREVNRLLKESNKLKTLPLDIPMSDTQENIYYRSDISISGYKFQGDFADFVKDQYELPNGIEIWGNGENLYMFVPTKINGHYRFGGRLIERA